MNTEEFTAKWIAAIRSGTYRQGPGFLNRQGFFCCLGVACDVYDASKWTENTLGSGVTTVVYEFVPGDQEFAYLPTELRQLLNLTMTEESHLASLNDKGYSFDDIALVIEHKFYKDALHIDNVIARLNAFKEELASVPS